MREPGDDRDPSPDDETVTQAHASTPPGRSPAASQRLPSHIADYAVLGILGEGGMGLVYEAEQKNPKRRVALKMMRSAALTRPSSVAMFEREVRTLARLRHPNIAQIYESGRDDDGLPFIAMELVRGGTLKDFLQSRPSLDAKELAFRLKLFRTLCLAIHHAHQRGVIHRDLKPGNVLVNDGVLDADGMPVLKILDFGLARMLDDDADEGDDRTAVGVIKGTLAYMSPEQAQGLTEEIDTRSDVYALGVILYEMLTGERPHEISSSSVMASVKEICESDPKPIRHAWPRAGVKLDPDVGTIVHTALHKDRERRYASAHELARDVDLHLRQKAIVARAPSAAYLLRKFTQRHRALVIGAAATTIALIAGIVAATVFAIGEARQRRATEQVAGFQEQVLAGVDPAQTGLLLFQAIRGQLQRTAEGRGLSDAERSELVAGFDRLSESLNSTDLARSLLDDNILLPASASATEQFAGQPLIEARLQHTLGLIYNAIGLNDRAAEVTGRARDLRRAELGRLDELTMESEFQLAQIEWQRGRFAAALAGLEELKALQVESLGPRHRRTLMTDWGLATVAFHSGEFDDALAVLDPLVTHQEEQLGPLHRDTVLSRSTLGGAHLRLGHYDEAETIFSALSAELDGAAGGDEDLRALRLDALSNLSAVHIAQSNLPAAAEILTELADERSTRFGEAHPSTLDTLNNLGIVLSHLGRHEESYQLGLRTLAISRRVHGTTHEQTRRMMNNLAARLTNIERFDEAAVMLDELLKLDLRAEPNSPNHAIHLHTYAELHMAREEWRPAKEKIRQAIAIYRSSGHGNLAGALQQLTEIEEHLNAS